jgi:hypothetical protein
MSANLLLRDAKSKLGKLSPERLRVAVDFLAYLEERESMEATKELLSIPGFTDTFEKAQKEIAAGRVVSAKKLQRKY